MSIEYTPEPKLKKILIVTSSGGGGLIQTANAKAQEMLAKYPAVQLARKDLLKDWVVNPVGYFFIKLWNNAQKKGNVSVLTAWVSLQFLADIFLHPNIFVCALYTLFKEDVDHVIDTQPLGTSAMIKALRIYNWKSGKNVRLEKVLVDLPTKKATHFFRPIKKLSKKNRQFLQLTTIAPLLDEGETAEEFWQSTCGLSEKEIHLEDVYVRQAFREYKGKVRSAEPTQIRISCKNAEEMSLVQKTSQRGSISSAIKEGEIEFSIDPADRVITVLLGSQPSSEAALSYVQKFASFARKYPKIMTHLFVFCADHKEGEPTLFRKVADVVSRMKDYPKNVSIIPFSFQTENVIAPLFYRSDITCTRSGGQTAMELMCVSTGEIWIHSEAHKDQDVLEGIPGWEAASAIYLKKLKGAKIITPDLIIPHATQVYQAHIGQTLSNRQLESTA